MGLWLVIVGGGEGGGCVGGGGGGTYGYQDAALAPVPAGSADCEVVWELGTRYAEVDVGVLRWC